MMEEYVDDSSGAILDPTLVKAARAEELAWLKKEKVYERVPAELHPGKPLQMKWLDINKGDNNSPKVRSRLVVREIRKAKPLDLQLGGADTFASTPPLEAVYALISLFMTKENSRRGKRKMAAWDISRAHFMGRATREILVTLPPEDEVQEGDPGPMVGRLLRSMYGTQDASKIFQDDYQSWMRDQGAEFCKLCPSLFRFVDRDLLGLVHGDDFLVVGAQPDLQWLDGVLNSRYTARWEATLGDESGDLKEMFFLNRLIRLVNDGTGQQLEIEADARHAEILLREFGFDHKTKGVDVPEDKMTQADLIEAETQEMLDDEQTKKFRSMVMRLAYLSADRPDLSHAVRTLASSMKGPKLGDWQRLKKVVRYLINKPYMKRIFKEQWLETAVVNAWSDSDWAGNLRTRRSTTGSVVKIGHHTILVKGASQKVVALSSAESEYYGMCRTATLAEFVRGILVFWGLDAKLVKLKVDSTAAKAMAERKGVGTNRHVQAKFLWLQDMVFEKKLAVEKVKGNINDSDLVTKVQPKGVISSHLERLNFQCAGRLGHKHLT